LFLIKLFLLVRLFGICPWNYTLPGGAFVEFKPTIGEASPLLPKMANIIIDWKFECKVTTQNLKKQIKKPLFSQELKKNICDGAS
jgi:hypothetical protein